MALLSEDKRKEIFKALKLGDYNKTNIKALQSKYLARKSDVDGIYGNNTDNLLRHLYNCHKYLNKDNFKPQEFKCECGGRYCCGYPTYMKPAQLTNLQTIRSKYKKPMVITSGMRCKGYNNAIGGSIANSKHLLGQATDFYMQGVTDTLANRKNFIKYAKNLPNTTYIYGNGINMYGNSISASYMGNAIHYDTNDGNPATTPTTKPTDEVKGEVKLTVDGIGGKATVKAMQKFFGTTQDGVISGQNISLQKKYYPALTAVQSGKGGSPCIKNLQRWVGTTQDGVLGQATVKAWQKKIGVTADGIFGTNSMKKWQTYLNNNAKPTYPTTTKPTTSSSTASKLVAKAKEVCWAYGTASSKWDYSTGNPTSAYNKICGNVKRVTKSDCGYFIKMITKAIGITAWNPLGDKVPSNFTIVHSGKKIPKGTLKAGDIIWYKKTGNAGQHTLMYYGDGKIAEAGREIRFPVIRSDTEKYNASNVKYDTIKVARAK